MKIFQILDGLCHWDATSEFRSIDIAKTSFSPEIQFIEAPDYVFEGWGYDDTQAGDARFLKPIPPDGFLYDEATGTFYDANYAPKLDAMTQTQIALAELAETESAHDLENKLALAELAEMIGGTTNG